MESIIIILVVLFICIPLLRWLYKMVQKENIKEYDEQRTNASVTSNSNVKVSEFEDLLCTVFDNMFKFLNAYRCR